VVPGLARRPRRRLDPRDMAGLLNQVERWKAEAAAAGRTIERVVLTYEAGRDGFWIARHLIARGIEVHIMHPASIPVARKKWRAKHALGLDPRDRPARPRDAAAQPARLGGARDGTSDRPSLAGFDAVTRPGGIERWQARLEAPAWPKLAPRSPRRRTLRAVSGGGLRSIAGGFVDNPLEGTMRLGSVQQGVAHKPTGASSAKAGI
jgi:hypothetical protein